MNRKELEEIIYQSILSVKNEESFIFEATEIILKNVDEYAEEQKPNCEDCACQRFSINHGGPSC